MVISFLFFTFPFFQKLRSENQKVKNKNGKVKKKKEITMSPPLNLRRLMKRSEEEVGLILPVFLRKRLDTDMPCD